MDWFHQTTEVADIGFILSLSQSNVLRKNDTLFRPFATIEELVPICLTPVDKPDRSATQWCAIEMLN